MAKAIDITGQKFGRLTAIKRVANNKRGEAMWLCRCECGNEKEVSASLLRKGVTKSCGCLRKEMAVEIGEKKTAAAEVGVSGRKFGTLTAVKRIGSNKYGKSVWLFKCDCGKTKEMVLSSVINGSIKSCGCVRRKKNAITGKTIGVNNLKFDCIENTRVRRIIADKPMKSNKTGYRGIWYNEVTGKYVASIGFQCKYVHIGTFDTAEEAASAYNAYKEKIHWEYIKKLKKEDPELYYKSLPKDIRHTLDVYEEKDTIEDVAVETNQDVEIVKKIIDKYGIKTVRHGSRTDLTNMKFGRLTVIRETKNRRHGYVVWECNCECGNCTYATTYELTSGHKKSCGCLAKEVSARNGRAALERWRKSNCINGKLMDAEKVQKNNTSGYTGVYKTNSEKWRAQIIFDGKRYDLGQYKSVEEAADARKTAKKETAGDFMNWYRETYPEKWERLQKKGKGKMDLENSG